MKKVISLAIVLLAGSLLIATMTTAQVSRATTSYTATLANAGSGDAGGSGTAAVTIDDATGDICYDVTFALTAGEALTAGHIHTHTDNSVVVPFAEAAGATASFNGCVTDSVTAAAIIANPGNFYVNLHDTSFPAGAIQGDLVADVVNTPTPTATATDVPVNGTELVVNGGFEDQLNGWTLKNAVGDKVKCDSETKIVAYEGICAFKFKGGAGENSKLQQVLTVSGTPAADDTIDLSAYLNAKKETVSGKMKLVVKYGDGSSSKSIATFAPSLEGYILIAGDQIVLTSADVSKVKLIISHKSPNGKAYLDAVSALWNTGSVATATPTDVPAETATPTETPTTAAPIPLP